MWIQLFWQDWALQIVAAASLLAAIVACVALLRSQRLARQNQQLRLRLEQTVKALNSSAVGMGNRLVELEQRINDEQEMEAAPRLAVSAVRLNRQLEESLEDAAALLASGVETEEVARRCGISRAEASLLKLMHNQVGKPSAA